MNSRALALTLLTTGFLLDTIPVHVLGQTKGLSSALVLRSQAGSVAEEAVSRLALLPSEPGRFGVKVEGGAERTLVENAFLESLSRRGIQASLVSVQEPVGRILQVVVLDQSVLFSGLPGGNYRREIQTAVEARRASDDSTKTQYLGLFTRHDVDTVAFRDDWALVHNSREGERTLFDRLWARFS